MQYKIYSITNLDILCDLHTIQTPFCYMQLLSNAVASYHFMVPFLYQQVSVNTVKPLL
jgi:hypothetical protein